jgi:putative hydrolase of the HAD superfamily
MTPVRSVCFDLGNVICDFTFRHTVNALSEALAIPRARVESALVFDDTYAAYERGELDTAGYREELGRRIGIPIPPAVFESAWNAIFEDIRPGMAGHIAGVARRIPVTVLSNTNHAHAEFWRRTYADALAPCARTFTSFELGVRKPEFEAYRAVLDFVNLPASDVLFFDDMRANVDAAIALGMQAVHVTAVDTVARALRDRGLIEP